MGKCVWVLACVFILTGCFGEKRQSSEPPPNEFGDRKPAVAPAPPPASQVKDSVANRSDRPSGDEAQSVDSSTPEPVAVPKDTFADKDDLIIADFETDADIRAWTKGLSDKVAKRVQRVSHSVAHGESALEVVFLPAGYPGISSSEIDLKRNGLSDWSGRDVLKFAVQSSGAVRLAIRIDDEHSTGYGTRFDDDVPLNAGVNYIQIPIPTISKAIDVSKVKLIVLFLYNTKQEYTLTFDYLAVGALDLNAEKKNMYARLAAMPTDPPYRMDVETEHTDWLSPYARGKVRVLFVPTVASGRDAIEIAQRLDCDYDVVAIDRGYGLNLWGYGDYIKARSKLSPLYWSILKKLDDRSGTDVLVIGRTFGWKYMPVQVQRDIIRRVNEGMGIVLINVGLTGYSGSAGYATEADENLLDSFALLTGSAQLAGGWKMGEVVDHPITRGVPFSTWPLERMRLCNYTVRKGSGARVILSAEDGRPVVAVGKAGKGRIVQIAYYNDGFAPWVDHGHFVIDEVRPYRYWETQYEFLARAVAWAAEKEPAVRIDITAPGRIAAGGTVPRVSIRVSSDTFQKKGELECVLRDGMENRILRSDRFPVIPSAGGETVEVALPEAVWGVNFIETRFFSDGVVQESACTAFERIPPIRIAPDGIRGIDTQNVYSTDKPIRFTVTVKSDSGRPEGRLRVELIDGFERVASAVTVPVDSDTMNVVLPVENNLSSICRVRVRLIKDGMTADRKTVMVYTRFSHEDDDDYCIFVSGDAWKYPYSETLPDIFRSFYVTQLNYSNQEAARGFSVVPESRLEGIDPRFSDRKRNYNYEKWFRNAQARYARTGDKKYLVKNPCLSDPEYIKRMQERHRRIARDNKLLGVDTFSVGDENSLTYYGAEMDFCFSEHCLREFHAWLKEAYPSVQALNASWKRQYASFDEAVPLTLKEALNEGNYAPWGDHREFMDVVMERTLLRARDALREIIPGAKISLSGTQRSSSFNGIDWFRIDGVLGAIRPYSIGSQDYLHLSFLKGRIIGCSGYGQKGKGVFHQIWERLITGQTSGQSVFWRYEMVNPDFTFSESGRDIAAIFREIRGRGIGKLLKDSTRSTGGIAIHYSMASLRAARLQNAEGAFEANWKAWTTLLEESGRQFRFIATQQIEDGILSSDRYKVLVLPRSVALSDREVEQISLFANAGGRVIADVMPGAMDRHLVKRDGVPLDVLFKTGKGVIAGDVTEYMSRRNDSEQVTAWREKVDDWMAPAGIGPMLNVTVGGVAITRAKMVRFDDGANVYWGLLKDNVSGKSVVMPDGTIEFILTGEPPAPERIVVDFGKSGYVYEVRSGRYYGKTRVVTDSLESAGMKLYAMLPYEVNGVSINALVGSKRGEPVTVGSKIQCVGKPGAHTIRVEVIGPDGVRRLHYGKNLRAEHGEASYTFRTALNDPAGEWTVRVTDVVSSKSAEAKIVIE